MSRMHRRWSAAGLRLLIQKHTSFLMSRNVQRMISNRNETLLMKNTQPMSKNVQGTISNGIEALLIQKHTSCKQKHTGDDQGQEWDSVDAETHQLFDEQECAGDNWWQEWDSFNTETYHLWAGMRRGWSVTRMRNCWYRNTPSFWWAGMCKGWSVMEWGSVGEEMHPLWARMQGWSVTGLRLCWYRNTLSVNEQGDDQWQEWDSFDTKTYHLWAGMSRGWSVTGIIMVGCRTGASRRYYHRTRSLSSRGGRVSRISRGLKGGQVV